MPLIRNASREVLGWASSKAMVEFCEPCSALGITDSRGRLVGAAVFNDYQQKNVALSIVGKGVFRLQALREIARFAYHELNCERVSATVRADNENVLNLAIKAGFRVEGRKRRYYPRGVDAIMLGMLRKECPFLEG